MHDDVKLDSDFMFREVLPSLCAYAFFAESDVCRFLPLVDSSLYFSSFVDPLFLKLLGVDAGFVECLRRARIEEDWKFRYSLRRVFWFLYLPFYYDMFRLWIGVFAGGVVVFSGFWSWLLFAFYNIPLFSLLWHLSDYIIYKCSMGGWGRLGFLIDKLSWLGGIIFYILSPVLIVRAVAYRFFFRIFGIVLEKKPVFQGLLSFIGKFFRGLVLLPGCVIDYAGWHRKGFRTRWGKDELKKLAVKVLKNYVRRFRGVLLDEFLDNVEFLASLVEDGRISVYPAGLDETLDANALLLLVGSRDADKPGIGGYVFAPVVKVADFYTREITEYLLLKEFFSLSWLVSGCKVLSFLLSGFLDVVRHPGVLACVVYGRICGRDVDVLLVVSDDCYEELKEKIEAYKESVLDIAIVKENELYNPLFFPLLYNVFIGKFRILKGEDRIYEFKSKLAHMLKENREGIAYALFNASIKDLLEAGKMLEARADPKSTCLRILLGIVTFIQSTEIMCGFPPSAKCSIACSKIVNFLGMEDRLFVEEVVNVYNIIKRGQINLDLNFVSKLYKRALSFVSRNSSFLVKVA
ncbi:MAG: hypothetical protein DRZ80_01615 [Thermoprotei archaeon]|nr:MAG: hypothetical protein DRZ80_01615 [Thermoprotei archaeon]